ncbi:MAG: branched-chain amino acid ABC transporter permease [Xanthobacteraceae bacterium]|nr:branched-chain amino acid ABC transporter permease [Xanthobacteraceae bacterium]
MTQVELIALAYQFGLAVAFLILSAAGLAVIFGMMGIVNMAHGELIMIGAYGTSIANRHGLPLVLAALCGVLASTATGVLLERTVIRRFYDRPSESLVMTWAIGLFISQAALIVFGPSLPSISSPLGSVAFGGFSLSIYGLLLIAFGLAVPVAIYLLLSTTTFGLHARATMQNVEVARAIGINSGSVYSATFALGAGLAGLAGALYAPTMSAVPNMGGSFIVQAFVTVVTGGGNLVYGTLPAAAGLGLVQTALTAVFGNLVGVLGLLAAVIVSAKLFPNGLAHRLSGKRFS